MSTFDNPFDPARRLRSGCSCGRHVTQEEHDRAMCVVEEAAAGEKRLETVVASAVMRAVFPSDAARRPLVPFVDVQIGPADRGAVDPDQDIVLGGLGIFNKDVEVTFSIEYAGIYQFEMAAVEADERRQAIARHTGCGIDDRDAFP